MSDERLTPQDYSERIEAAGEWRLRLTSYRLGDSWICTADNVDPGANLARARGDSREVAEAEALERARSKLAETRRIR